VYYNCKSNCNNIIVVNKNFGDYLILCPNDTDNCIIALSAEASRRNCFVFGKKKSGKIKDKEFHAKITDSVFISNISCGFLWRIKYT